MAIFNERLKQLRISSNMTQDELANKLGVSKSAISMYEHGNREPDFEMLEKIADFFNVNMDYLHGYNNEILTPNRIPVLGSVPAGIPIEAIEDVVDFEDIPMDWLASGIKYFGLKVKGDSMSPKYIDGDTIIVRVQSDCESGQDAVAYVNGYDATLKKVIKKADCIVLQPLNPAYDPQVYDYNDPDNPVTIAGIVVEIRRTV